MEYLHERFLLAAATRLLCYHALMSVTTDTLVSAAWETVPEKGRRPPAPTGSRHLPQDPVCGKAGLNHEGTHEETVMPRWPVGDDSVRARQQRAHVPALSHLGGSDHLTSRGCRLCGSDSLQTMMQTRWELGCRILLTSKFPRHCGSGQVPCDLLLAKTFHRLGQLPISWREAACSSSGCR